MINKKTNSCRKYSHGESKKLATVVLLSYNQEDFVMDAIEGALNQSYSPLEIIISDDCSTDATWDIIQATLACYSGVHDVKVQRNRKNLGINRHFNRLMSMVKGEYIIIMAGDDISDYDRVSKSVGVMEAQQVSGLYTNAIKIDASGSEVEEVFHSGLTAMSWLRMLEEGNNGGAGFSMAWRKSILNVFPLVPDEPLGEDAFIPFRCAILSGFAYVDEPLVKYRCHGNNLSFWNLSGAAKSSLERLNIARKEIDHHKKIQISRLEDIRHAVEVGAVPQEMLALVMGKVNQYLLLTQIKEDILADSFFIHSWRLFKARGHFKCEKWRFPALRFWYKSLAYYYPYLYTWLHALLGKMKGLLYGI